jgi:trigger factor
MAEEEQATLETKNEQPPATEDKQESAGPKNIVAIEQAGPCKKKVTVEIPQQAIKNATDKQYDTLRKEALVPGFRKGRAPRRLLEKRFGKETAEQIKLKLLIEASDSAIKDNKLDILGEPTIDHEKVELPEAGPLKFDFQVDVRPVITLPPLEGTPVTRAKLEVTDEQVDREIGQLRRFSGVWTPRETGDVQLDDQIIADVVLKAADAEKEEQLDNIEVYVRHNGFVAAVPVEKLDELLVGAKPQDVREICVEVPRTYFREQYRGKKVDVRITVKEIKWLKPADLDENFLKRYKVANEAELRDKLRDRLHSQLEQQSRADMTEQIYKYLRDKTDFDLPLDIVGEHSLTLLQRQYGNLLMRGLTREQIEQHMDRLRASSEQQAKEQLKTFFIMDEVAKKLGIEVSEEEINGHIAQLAIQQGQRPERMREQMVREGLLAQFTLQVRENKCIAKLLESAKITETEPQAQPEAKAAKKPKRKSAKGKAKDQDSGPVSRESEE